MTANPLRAENLRHFRLAHGLSQIAMGERCSMPSNTVCMMEGGLLPISIKTIDRIAAAFEMSPAMILAELDSTAPREPIASSVPRHCKELAEIMAGDGTSQDRLVRFEATLEGRDLDIFRDRIIADDPVSLQALGDRWQVSRERIRQLESRLLQLLRDHKLLENP